MNIIKSWNNKIYIAICLLGVNISTGVAGFRYFAGYSWIDALYMTIITMTTVGFGEVHPLDEKGRLFTVFLISTSVFIFAYSISTISEYIISKNHPKSIYLRKMKKMISKLEEHTIIIGYGRNGKQAAAKLAIYDQPFVVIEHDDEVINKLPK